MDYSYYTNIVRYLFMFSESFYHIMKIMWYLSAYIVRSSLSRIFICSLSELITYILVVFMLE